MAEKVCSSEVLPSIAVKLEHNKTCMQNQCTAVLWMQYMGMVDVLRKFIKAERTAKWDLHLQAVYDMLPCCCCGSQPVYEIGLQISADDV